MCCQSEHYVLLFNFSIVDRKKRLFFFFLRFYLLIHERHTERGRDTGRGRSRLHAGSPMWDLIPGPRDHAPSRRQMLNHWATQASSITIYILIYHVCPNISEVFLRFYLFIHERERGRDTGSGRSRLHAGSPTWDLILGLQDQNLGWRRC